jgi:hypothetical protein
MMLVKAMNRRSSIVDGYCWSTFTIEERETLPAAIDLARIAAKSRVYDRVLVVDGKVWDYKAAEGPGVLWDSGE